MMSTAIGQWRGMIHRVMSGLKSAVFVPHEGEWAWHLLGSICMLLVVMMAVHPYRLLSGEREGRGGGEGLSVSYPTTCSGMILTSTSGPRWLPWLRGEQEWEW